MSDEIVVKVNSYGPGRPLSLVYFDPVSGRKKAKSSSTTDWREAERLAGELEKELRAGRYAPASKVTWADFRKRYEAEKLSALSPKTGHSFKSAANHLERVLNPDRLCKLTAAVLSRFQAKLREEGMGETTISTTLRHLRACFSWGESVGLLPAVPRMVIPRAGGAKARAVSGEEFDRMITAVAKIRPHDAAAWEFYLRGLYLGGLRLGESLALSWDDDATFAVDLTGRRPAFRISAAAQKARRDERLPMTEDFYDLIMGTPEAERVGKVFKLDGTFTGTAITPLRVCRTVSEIGKAAGVVVAMVEKRKRIDGKLTTTTGKKFASAHDLRRAFGTRWAKRLMPAVLKRLMRHSDVATTMTYYVTIDADAVADAVWGRNWEAGNTLGNNRPTKATATERGQADESTEAIAAFQVTSAVSATARFPTPCPAADRTAAWAAWCGPAVPDEAHPAESGARGGGGTWHRPLPQVSDGRWGPWGRGYLGGRPPKLPKPAQTIAQVNGRRKWGPWGRVVS